MYLDPAVVRRALEAPGDASAALQELVGLGGAPLPQAGAPHPRADASLSPGVAAIGAPGLVELVDWDGEGGAERPSPPGLAAARAAVRALRVLPLTAYEVFLAADLVRTYPELPSRAALHVAIMLNNGELELVSDDPAFDQVSEIRRIPPARVAKTLARRRTGAGGRTPPLGRVPGESAEPDSPPVGESSLPTRSGEGGHHP